MDGFDDHTGHLKARLETFQDSGLTDLNVDPCAVTATYTYADGDPFFILRVSSEGSSGISSVSVHEVIYGDFDAQTMSRRRNVGLSLAELREHPNGPGKDFWDSAIASLLALQEVAAELIEEAASAAAEKAADRLQRQWQKPADPPPFPDVESRFTAFQEACQRRAPYCAGIQLSWDADFDGLPGVVFGLAPGKPEQVLYQADPHRSKQLYLNGFWTGTHILENDLLEQFPSDAWARLGARNAAQDLLAIQQAGHELMQTQREFTLQDLDIERTRQRYQSVLHGPRPLNEPGAWNAWATESLRDDGVALFERVGDYLNTLHPKSGYA